MFSSSTAAVAQWPRARPKPLSLSRPFSPPLARLAPSFPRPFGDRHLDYPHSRCELRRSPRPSAAAIILLLS